MDRKQRLIRFSEPFRGENARVVVHPREVVRDALACGVEQLPCVRSDPIGDRQPTAYDIEDARRVKRALDLLAIPLVDYVIVGESVTSLLQRRVIRVASRKSYPARIRKRALISISSLYRRRSSLPLSTAYIAIRSASSLPSVPTCALT